MMEYLATFYTHYGAMRFKKDCGRNGISVTLAPVPRELSASCGVCARFSGAAAADVSAHEDMESCYAVSADGKYELVGRSADDGYTEDQ